MPSSSLSAEALLTAFKTSPPGSLPDNSSTFSFLSPQLWKLPAASATFYSERSQGVVVKSRNFEASQVA